VRALFFQRLFYPRGQTISIHITCHHDAIVDEHQWVRPVALLGLCENVGVLCLDLGCSCVIVLQVDLLSKNAIKIPLDQVRGLLRRPTRASTSATDFVLTVSQDCNLNLLYFLHNNPYSLKVLTNWTMFLRSGIPTYWAAAFP